MHFVIMGAGRVGVTLAQTLEEHGHSVGIIDQNPDAFRRLSPDFEGRRVTGLGFDRDALVQAGIEDARAFAAVSSGDNSNIIAARVVRETFGVNDVVARIYDPRRAEVYQRFGITTVATVRWTADQVLRRMIPRGADSEFTDASGRVRLCEMDTHPGWVGSSMRDIQRLSRARVAFLTRLGEGYIPTPDELLQESDVVHMLVETPRVNDVQRVLAVRPPVEKE
ncbi:TrkA family potassium uptake protein [Pseudactinotalea suaedae]